MRWSLCRCRGVSGFLIVLVILVCVPLEVLAVPTLQLYLEGGFYDNTDQSWVIVGEGDPLRIWAIGNVAGPGGKGMISDVRMVMAFSAGLNPVVTLTPSIASGYGGFWDPSEPQAPVLMTSTPQNGPARVPSHSVYGAGTDWVEFSLGDFTLDDSPVADFRESFPATPDKTGGQINVYEASFQGLSLGDVVHFDLHGMSDGNFRIAPFSHDARFVVGSPEVGPEPVPEPGTLTLMLLGVMGVTRGIKFHGSRRGGEGFFR